MIGRRRYDAPVLIGALTLSLAFGCARPTAAPRTAPASRPIVVTTRPACPDIAPREVVLAPSYPPRFDDCQRDCAARERARRGPSVVPEILAALRSPDPDIRDEAYAVIEWLGPAARAALPTVLENVRERGERAVWDVPDVRAVRMRAELRRTERENRYVQPRRASALAELGDEEPSFGFGDSISVLRASGPEDADAAAVLRIARAMERDLAFLRTGAPAEHHSRRLEGRIHALATLGPVARAALPALSRVEREAVPPIAESAARAIVAIDDGDDALRVTLRALADPRRAIEASEWVATLGERGRAAVPMIAELVRRRPFDVTPEAMLALASVGGEEAVSVLAGALRAPRPQTAAAAARSLGEVGPMACSAIPALRSAREHWSMRVRWEVARALSALEGGPIEPAPLTEPAASTFGELLQVACASLPPRATVDPPASTVGCASDDSVPVGGECLFGGSFGEWGGAILAVPKGEKARPTHEVTRTPQGVWLLLPWPGGAIAITRMNHMATLPAVVLRVQRGAGGWTVSPLVELPGYPLDFRLLEHELVIVSEDFAGSSFGPSTTSAFGIDESGRVRRLASVRPKEAPK